MNKLPSRARRPEGEEVMSYRSAVARVTQGAVLTILLLVALPAASAQATVTKPVSIVAPSSTCKALFACYKPSSLTIAPGTQVLWTNTTTITHTVTACTVAACGISGGAGPNSPFLGHGAKYGFTFTKKGTFVYYCKIHGYKQMHAKVVVS
jgi:plastocyanin